MLATSTVLVLFCFFLQSAHLAALAASHADPSLLHLNEGLNLSVSASFNATGFPISQDRMFTAAIAAQAYYDDGVFLPILSSPGFNSTNSPQSLGFSVGFFFSIDSPFDGTYDIYLAACGGRSGNYSNITEYSSVLSGSDDGSFSLSAGIVADGYAVPVWIANLDSPLRSVNSSLVVVEVSGIKELQLRDHNGTVVWNVSNVGMMEMQDTGILVINDSTSNVVWQSSRDTLLLGQNLTVGKELRSNDSQYLARMEKGGLVLYYLNAQFIQQPSPYWVIPILLSSTSNLLDLNTLVSSSPCSRPDDDTAYSTIVFLFLLLTAPCIVFPTGPLFPYFSWSFMKLENDGMLYMYTVSSQTIPPSLTGRSKLDTSQWLTNNPASLISIGSGGKASWWGECDVPMACGPLGVCSPQAPSLCACPQNPPEDSTDFFEAKNNSDFSKGCTRHTPLPNCKSGNEHMINNATDFLQLNHTASIFLFGGWAFASTISSAPVEECKKSCSANCSCNGFFYQANTSSCFFITDEITLINVIDQNLTYVDTIDDILLSQEIFARNYVTYLKVTSAARSDNSSEAGKSTQAASSFVIAITIVSTFVACSVLGLAVYLCSARKSKLRRRSMQASHAKEEQELQDILPLLPTRFSYQDLHEATEAFSTLLGAGGCGTVYAGMLPDGRKIAVKKLETLLKGQSKQFLAEVATIGRTSHHNIVRLVGFCWELLHRLLVYEYVERGSLDHWLFAKGEANKSAAAADGEAAPDLLNWQTRYSIALGIARGLSYLHGECPQPILHFDIKPQNILLDGAFVAKLADFGMSRLMQRDDVSEVITGVRGTPGYIAPEWLSHGVVSKKSDVYSMGMVMLEIVGGRRNVDLALLSNTVDPEEWHFPSWAANKCKQGLMMELVDKRLETFEEDQVQRLIHIAFWCIHENPGMRPYAPTVVKWLEGSSPVKEPPFSTPVHSQCHVQSSS